jgi:hypothetical protein
MSLEPGSINFSENSLKLFIDKMNNLKIQDSECYVEVKSLIEKIIKSCLLIKNQPAYIMSSTPLELLILMKTNDDDKKIQLKQLNLDELEKNCHYLPSDTLVVLLKFSQKEKLLEYLKAEKRKLSSKLKERQNHFAELMGRYQKEINEEEADNSRPEIKDKGFLPNSQDIREKLNFDQFISVMLAALNVPQNPISNLPLDHENIYEYYCYPSQIFTQDLLLKDQLNYFLSHADRLSHRRVGFILECQNNYLNSKERPVLKAEAIVLWVEYTKISNKTVESLKKALLKKNESSEQLVKLYSELLKKLYVSVRCWIIEIVNSKELEVKIAEKSSQYFKPYFDYSFSQYSLRFQPVYAKPQPEIVLTQCLFDLLLQGTLVPMDVEQSSLKFQKACAVVLSKQLASLKEVDLMFFKKFHKIIQILTKYGALSICHSKLNIQDKSISLLEKMQQEDLLAKKKIYGAIFDNTDNLINSLNLKILAILLIHIQHKDYPQILEYLKELKQQEFSHLKQWEADLSDAIHNQKKSWKNYLSWVSQKSAAYLYQNTFIGLSAELTRLIAQCFSENPTTSTISKWVGALGGVLYTYYAGSYSLARLLLIGGVGYFLQEQLGEFQFNDAKAKLIPPKIKFGGFLNFIKIASVLVAGLETAIQQDFIYFLKAVGGISGSLGLVKLAQPLLLKFQANPNQPLTEEKFLILFFSSLMGNEIGHSLSGTFYQGIDKWLMQDDFIKAFCEKLQLRNATGCQGEFSLQPPWTPTFWLNSNDTVRVSWTERKEYYESQCDVVKYYGNQRTVICDEPALIEVKRLGK